VIVNLDIIDCGRDADIGDILELEHLRAAVGFSHDPALLPAARRWQQRAREIERKYRDQCCGLRPEHNDRWRIVEVAGAHVLSAGLMIRVIEQLAGVCRGSTGAS
jgi:hypothetical protein